jgi:ATP-dependent protease ClpP protease subunit
MIAFALAVVLAAAPVTYHMHDIVGHSMADDFNTAITGVEAACADDATKCAFEIRIDSPGGDVLAMVRMAARLEVAAAHGVKTACVVEGVALSAAGLIFVTCPVRHMPPSGQLMLHSVVSLTGGTQEDVARGLKQFARVNDLVVDMIVRGSRGKLSREDVAARVGGRNEWWLSREEALAAGLTDD